MGGETVRTEGRMRVVEYFCTYTSSSSDLTQIAGTRAEPQQIVAQRLLSCLQYPVPFKSSTKDLTRPTYKIILTV